MHHFCLAFHSGYGLFVVSPIATGKCWIACSPSLLAEFGILINGCSIFFVVGGTVESDSGCDSASITITAAGC